MDRVAEAWFSPCNNARQARRTTQPRNKQRAEHVKAFGIYFLALTNEPMRENKTPNAAPPVLYTSFE